LSGPDSPSPLRAAPAVFTIPAGSPFLDALADGILAQAGDGPDALTDYRIFLPTRRACRGLRDAFLRRGGGKPMLLPRLLPLGDMDEDELAISEAGDAAGGLSSADAPPGAEELPPAIPGLRRQILLTRLVLALRGGDTTPEQAAMLAAELGRLLDQVHTERLDFADLADLVPRDFAEHWQITLKFLTILTELWPAVLADEGCLDSADRRNRLLTLQAESWRKSPPQTPVIAAGSTGSIPATADLLSAIARLPQGCVVLPGLDRAARPITDPSHPQTGMQALLAKLGVKPADVPDWPAPSHPPVENPRRRLVNTALQPADATRGWHAEAAFTADCLDGVTRIDCPGPREEAGVVALMMREVLEADGTTAALVTPDRTLARRVATELRRWQVGVDDSAGQPLAHTPASAFLLLAGRMVAEGFAPVPMLAALKHPLAGCGRSLSQCRAEVRRLEIAALRGPRPAPGLDGLRAVLGEAAAEFDGLLGYLDQAGERFRNLVSAGEADAEALTDALIELAESLAATDEEPGADRLWVGETGEAAAAFIADLRDSAGALGALDGSRFPGLLEALMIGRSVRPRFGQHPRLHILGPLEARLIQTDVLILGGLNEGVWPPETQSGPWMSRPMMQSFGLPLPERRIGLAAHDFAQAFCAKRVVLTRASRVGGTPTVPSRWLLRLETLLAGSGLAGRFRPDSRWLDWFERLDAVPPEDSVQIQAPAPKPSVAVRPRRLSVTQIETWIRDPYAIFARHILGLKPLDPIDADPTAAERGIIVHGALERFTEEFPADLGPDALERLLRIGHKEFEETASQPGIRAFWWPRFERLARWFIEFEAARRAAGIRVQATEVDGNMKLDAPAGPFELVARADRFDRLADGSLAILDYKTGQAPSWPQVKSGLVPQLSLEAAMAAQGAFGGVDPAAVAELIYVRLTGARVPGEGRVLDKEIAEIAADALSGLARRIARFDDPKTPYRSRPRPMFARAFGDYDHLARVKEWATGGGGDE